MKVHVLSVADRPTQANTVKNVVAGESLEKLSTISLFLGKQRRLVRLTVGHKVLSLKTREHHPYELPI